MGIGFVILLHLVGIFILGVILALLGSIATYFISKKERRKRKFFLATISPFIGLYTLYFTALFGAIIVSEYKNVDIGIGDAWYVPLSDNCELLFIDIPEQGIIKCKDQHIISEVSQMQQVERDIYGKTEQGAYFSFNTTTKVLKEFSNEYDFKSSNKEIILKDSIDLYYERRNEIAGFSLTAVGIISVLISIFLVYLTGRIVLMKFQ